MKVSVATSLHHSAGGQFVAHVKALPGNPFDGHTLATVIPDIESKIGGLDPAHCRRPGLARPQRAAKPQVQGLHHRAKARHDQSHRARCAAGPPSNPSSATPRPTTAWTATTSRERTVTPSTPCSPEPATTSAASSPGSGGFGASCARYARYAASREETLVPIRA